MHCLGRNHCAFSLAPIAQGRPKSQEGPRTQPPPLRAVQFLMLGAFVLAMAACQPTQDEAPVVVVEAPTSGVTPDRLVAADAEPGSWLSHGRSYSEQRFSPLDQINAETVADLGVLWTHDTGRTARARGNAPVRRWCALPDDALE